MLIKEKKRKNENKTENIQKYCHLFFHILFFEFLTNKTIDIITKLYLLIKVINNIKKKGEREIENNEIIISLF